MARELRPNSTQIPDVILDFWLSELSGAELKVVLYIARRTYGFGKESDNISLTQICSGIKKRDGTVLDTGTGLSRSSVARAIKTLEEKAIILRKINLSETRNEHEESTYSLNLDWQRNRGSDSGGGGGKGVVPKSNHPVSKGEERWSQNRTTRSPRIEPGVVPKSNPQETEQETGQETAAEEAREATERQENPVAELIEELVRQGLNRNDAIRLAHHKPEECRRQRDYLRFRIQTGFQFRSGQGAFLRRAIEESFAAPTGYEKAKQAETQRAHEKARSEAELTHSALKSSRLKETLAHLEIEHPEAYLDFLAYVETRKQEAISKPILNNAPDVKERLLKTFDTEAARLELLEEYLRHHPYPVPEVPVGLTSHPTSASTGDLRLPDPVTSTML